MYNTNVTTASTTVALRYEYAIRDHLGNTRLMFADLDGSGTVSSSEILQENHYYPFGMNMEGVWLNDAASKDSKYQYNGKELNDNFGLGWSDYGARWYDAAIGRWGQVDPLAMKSKHTSGYCYAYNSPFMFIDPTGEENMIYLVFLKNNDVKLKNSHIVEILRIAQRILDKAGAKAQVKAV
ncbi:MAG: RHS repeat-associated core domain-containing protein, partial [Bacteroidota bacterium]|nr:RHS repeat-associated core domain-containing protein [Bacteroidota bacterium]